MTSIATRARPCSPQRRPGAGSLTKVVRLAATSFCPPSPSFGDAVSSLHARICTRPRGAPVHWLSTGLSALAAAHPPALLVISSVVCSRISSLEPHPRPGLRSPLHARLLHISTPT